MRKIGVLLFAFAALPLGGCALQAALLAADLAQYLPEQHGPSNAHLRPTAVRACTERAGQYGSVYIVDISQPRSDRIIVGGSVTDAQQRRRTFECQFTTAIVSFQMQDIRPAS